MSAFVQDKAHIDALVAVAVRGPSGEAVQPDHAWYGVTWEEEPGKFVRTNHADADELGRMLWTENVRSVQFRYPDTIDDPSHMPGPIEFTPADVLIYTWPMSTPRLTAVDALAALSGYEYQACEHPDWMESQAYRFCLALRRSLCGVIERQSKRQGMWSISTSDLQSYRAEQLGIIR